LQSLAAQVVGLQNNLHNMQSLLNGTLGTIRNEIGDLKVLLESNRAKAGANEAEIAGLAKRVASLAADADSLRKASVSLDERAKRSEASLVSLDERAGKSEASAAQSL